MNPRVNYYELLGIPDTATQDDVKRAYRLLAKQYHPDSSGGDKTAEEKFKQVSEAYQVLSDSKKRSKYDLIRQNAARRQQVNFPGGHANSYQVNSENMQDIFSNLFNGFTEPGQDDQSFGDIGFDEFLRNSRNASAKRGTDMESTITIPFEMAVNGGETIIKTGGGKKVKIKIPSGIEDGKKIRIRGHGSPPPAGGGAAGDLYLSIKIAKHLEFERRGNDIYSNIYINIAEAVLGTELSVKTITGKRVKLQIPPGTSSAKIFRIPGLGVKNESGQGDHFVRIEIDVPPNLSIAQKRDFRNWAKKVGLVK
ncbi:MAG: J domain-containing protein [Calditrichaeota bacterium]|nr:J domain-containing protein [Calditrichota bacterium]MCB0303127.1 J domain-containing protein [Calditrichota bacterium]MCB0316377.1 J domain-containing protein [Calditrichota bacterium]MCB9087876.1 J domain-containing protein [Calditrichia bacterium]